MENICKNDEDIAKVLSELDNFPSEPDDPTFIDDNSETEDHTEVDSEYHSDASVDGTDSQYYPPDFEMGRPVSLFDTNQGENTDSLRICSSIIGHSALPLENQGNPSTLPLNFNQIDEANETNGQTMDLELPNYTITDLNKPGPSCGYIGISSPAFCFDQTSSNGNNSVNGQDANIIQPNVNVFDELIDTVLPTPEVNLVKNSSTPNQTILTMNFDSEEECVSYMPSSSESTMSDDSLDLEINNDEIVDLVRQSSKISCMNKTQQIVTLPSLSHHKNIVLPKKRNMRGKNGFLWSSKPKTQSSRTPRRNIVHFRQRPANNAKNVQNPTDAFKLFITPSMVDKIVVNTNIEINNKRQKYTSNPNLSTVSETTPEEINALLGLLVMSAAMKDNHLSTEELFDPTFSGSRYVSVMSRNRFDFLLNCLRFDDKTTRPARRLVDKLAPIREIWDEFVESCRSNYVPGSYVTIDEQLLGFRGRCPFKMYIPSKPNKYGMKIVMLCDVTTKYMIDAMPYLGKNTNTSGLPQGAYFVTELTKTIHGSFRNVTMDNWFTSVNLAKDMLNNHKLTIVGTLRSDKREIPPEMSVKQDRKVNSAMFGYSNELVLLSYKAKKNKLVFLLSTTHEVGTIREESGKPEIIHFYNETKGAVDSFDEMSSNMSTSRKTQRWPLCFFFGMLNSTLVNAFVIYTHRLIQENKKPVTRREFAKLVSEELMKPWLEARLQVPTMHRNLKVKIMEILGSSIPVADCQGQEAPKRKICAFCPPKKRRMTQYVCFSCKKHMCMEHRGMLCTDCSENTI